MLSYVYQSLKESGYDNVAAEDFDNIHDLFAAIIVRGAGSQVKRGLHRDYIRCEEALAGVRGQIRISETIKQQMLPQGKLVCLYDEFTEDSPHNRALKSTMLMLLRHGRVKPENKPPLRKMLLYLDNVTEIAPASIRWDALKYHRNNASYRMLMGICRLAVKGLLLTTETGKHRLASWLNDNEMHRLYERFVLAYYQLHHPSLSPRAAYIDWDVRGRSDKTYLPAMKSDITLSNGKRKLIIDTKYYDHTMQTNSLYGSTKFISTNIYQIYSYVKNSDKDATGDVAGMLLYAKTDEAVTPDDGFNIGGNTISLKTLDLNREWPAIVEQLERLCLWVKAEVEVEGSLSH
jgi:5-methylcytosine-specific restriction enzyme subunit McrC